MPPNRGGGGEAKIRFAPELDGEIGASHRDVFTATAISPNVNRLTAPSTLAPKMSSLLLVRSRRQHHHHLPPPLPRFLISSSLLIPYFPIGRDIEGTNKSGTLASPR